MIFSVEYAAFNLSITTLLFLLALGLRRLAQNSSNIPPPHFINKIVDFVDNILPMPQQTKDAEDAQNGHYSKVAYVFNNLIYGFITCLYIVVIVFSFVF